MNDLERDRALTGKSDKPSPPVHERRRLISTLGRDRGASVGQLRRRRFLIASSALIALPSSRLLAQNVASKTARIGVLVPFSRHQSSTYLKLAAALGKLGWTEGGNAVFDWRFAEGRTEDLPRLAGELVSVRPDVLVCVTNFAAKAVLQSTHSIPAVLWFALDPVGVGMAQSLAHPGGNVTGVLYSDPELASKMVEVLHEAALNMHTLGVLYDSAVPGFQSRIDADKQAARTIGVEFRTYPVRSAGDLSRAFDAIRKDRVDGLLVGAGGVIAGGGLDRVVEFAASNSIPAVYPAPGIVERGGFLSYSPNFAEVRTRVAAIVDKILRGAKPGDIAFEYATRFDLTVNLKSAKALGLNLPQSLLLQADRVIE